MKISFNPLYNFSHSLDVMVGQLSIAKILYKSDPQTYSVYSEVAKEYLVENLSSQDEAKLFVKHYFRDLFDKIDVGEIQISYEGCIELKELLNAEIKIIKKHLNRHKWFKHIEDENLAAVSFAQDYGFILKEFYCAYVCKLRGECKHSIDLINGEIEKNPEGLNDEEGEKNEN